MRCARVGVGGGGVGEVEDRAVGGVSMVIDNVHENFRSLISSMALNHEASARCPR